MSLLFVSLKPKAQDDVLKCVVLPTTQRSSIYCFDEKIDQTDILIIKTVSN